MRYPAFFKNETASEHIGYCLFSANKLQMAVWKTNHIESLFYVSENAYDKIELMRIRNSMDPCSAADYKAITAKISTSILEAAKEASIDKAPNVS